MRFSRGTKRLLLRIFFSVAEFERKANEIKLTAQRSPTCNAELVLNSLDEENTGKIHENSILKMLWKYCSHVKISDVQTIFNYVGVAEGNPYISREKFMEALEPCPNSDSANTNSNSCRVGGPNICKQCFYESELFLAELFLFELRSIKRLDTLRAKLLTKEDFSIFEGFSYMDALNEGGISADGICHHFDHYQLMYVPMHIHGIFKQLDKDQDGFISLLEFVDAIFPTYLYKSFPVSVKLKRSQLSQKFKQTNPKSDLQLQCDESFQSDKKSQENSFNKSSPQSYTNWSKHLENSNTEKRLKYVFNEQFEQLQMLKKDQESLAQRHDFNLIQLWHIIDPNNRGYTTAHGLKNTLKTLGTNISLKDIYYFVDTFSRECDGRVRYVDLCDAMLPKDSFLASKVQNRSAKYTNNGISIMFYSETKKLIGNVLKTQINIEKLIHSLKITSEVRKMIRSLNDKRSNKDDSLAFFDNAFGKYIKDYTPDVTCTLLERLVVGI